MRTMCFSGHVCRQRSMTMLQHFPPRHSYFALIRAAACSVGLPLFVAALSCSAMESKGEAMPGPDQKDNDSESYAELAKLETSGDPDAVFKLIPLLRTEDETFADAVVSVLSKLAATRFGITQLSCSQPSQSDPERVRFRMITVLRDAHRTEAELLLVNFLRDMDPSVREAALSALPINGTQRYSPSYLIALLGSAASSDVIGSTLALGRMKHIPAIPNLIGLLSHPDPVIGANALWALKRITGQNYAPVGTLWTAWFETEQRESRLRLNLLLPAVLERTPDHIAAALESLVQFVLIRDEVTLAVLPLASDDAFQVRAAVCSILGQIGGDSALPTLLQALRDSSDEVRFAAWRALKSITGLDLPNSFDTWNKWSMDR